MTTTAQIATHRNGKKRPNREIILDHLRHVGSISAAEAEEVYGIRRLAARIGELRHQWRIVSKLKEDAAGSRYARYHLLPS